MLVILCPHCGPRNSEEFRYQGEVVERPDVAITDSTRWREYLYTKANESGWVTERWFHVSGCRRFLAVERHTHTNEIISARELGGTR